MIWNHCLRYLYAITLFLTSLGIILTEPGNIHSAETTSIEKTDDEKSGGSELDALIKEMNRHYKKKRYKVALELGKELLKEIENTEGVDWEKLTDVYFGIAFSYYALGDYAGMDNYFEKTIMHIRQTAEKEGEEYCNCDGLKMFADIYRKMKLYDRAEKMYLESLRETEKARGPIHKSLIPQLDALVEINLERLNYPTAKTYLQRSVRITEKRLGPKHAKTYEKKEKLNALATLIEQETTKSIPVTASRLSPTIFVQTGHTDEIASVSFSPDSKYAVTAGWDNYLKLWDVSSGREVRTFRGHTSYVLTARFVPGGKYILSGSIDKTLRLWRLSTGREVRRFFGHHAEIISLAVSPDGRQALSGGADKAVILWDLTTGEKLQTFQGHKKWVKQVGFMEDGKRIFSVGKQFIVWDKITGQMLISKPSPGRIYANGSRYRKFSKTVIEIGNLVTGKTLQAINLEKAIRQTVRRTDKDGTRIVFTREKRVHVLNAETGNLESVLVGQIQESQAKAVSPDNRYLLTGGQQLVLFDLESGRKRWTVKGSADLRPLRVSVNKEKNSAFIKSDRGQSFKDPNLAAWDLQTGKRLFSRNTVADDLRGIAVSSDGLHYYVGTGGKVLMKNLQTGDLINTLFDYPGKIVRIEAAPGDLYLVVRSRKELDKKIPPRKKSKTIAATKRKGKKKRRKKEKKLSDNYEYYTFIWNLKRAKKIYSDKKYRRIVVSHDGSFFVAATDDGFETRSIHTGSVIHSYGGIPGGPGQLAISSDSRFIAATGPKKTDQKRAHYLKLWDLRTNTLVKTITPIDLRYKPVFTIDKKFLLIFSGKKSAKLKILDLATSEIVNTAALDRGIYPMHHWYPAVTDRMLFRYSLAYNRFDEFAGNQDSVALVDFSGKTIRKFERHDGWVTDAEPLPNTGRLLSVSYDKTMRLWDSKTGEEICRFYSFADGEWLVMTPAGFFNASKKGAKYINVSIGMQVYSIDQFHDILYRPDLIEARLQGDPQGLFAKAIAKHDLAAILSRGAAPRVTYLSPKSGEVDSRDVALEVKLTDRGGGFGKVVWKLNGITRGVAKAGRGIEVSPAEKNLDSRQERVLSKRLTPSPGVNRIECIAYNRDGRIAAVPEVLELVFKDESKAQPNLHLLTVGINRYRDRSLWLNFAVPDAKGMAQRLNETAGNIFKSVHVTEVLDQDARVDRIADVFKDLEKRVSSNDIFIFYLSGHGVTLEGQYHFLPADFRYHNEDSIRDKAINQDMLQRWLGKIAAEKNLVLLDTCNSGAFIQPHMATRGIAEKTAIEKLNRATGRAIIAASSDSQVALEGYQGHGVFTYTLLKSLVEADSKNGNRDGLTSTTEIAAYVGERVPEVTYQEWGYEQVPQILLHGNDFPVGVVR